MCELLHNRNAVSFDTIADFEVICQFPTVLKRKRRYLYGTGARNTEKMATIRAGRVSGDITL